MALKEKIDRFLAYNQGRKLKAVKFKESKASFFFKIIPFLLHSNYPDLPGYVDNADCPFGIYLFNPQKVINRDLFQRYFQYSTALRKDSDSPFSEQPYIHSLKTIGSIGTVAQSEKSDCDYWVSIRYSELTEKGTTLLEQKCQAIEQWADTYGYEVHFFLMDIDQSRENSFASKAEDESAGSSLKLLLKDELFRTHILVAGKIPLWWLIPPGLSDSEYKSYVNELPTRFNLNLNSFIDLGYISDLPKAEIFGACLWQMNKALDSPFKSVIKFAYLELLLATDKAQSLRLFSDTIKCLVTFPENLTADDQSLELEDIDPYLLLAREIVAFYQSEKTEKKRDQFIRICFFLKSLEGMASQKRSADKNCRLKSITEIMEDWDLLPDNKSYYLNFQHWPYKDIVDLGAKVHNYLIDTYKRLRWYFRKFDKEQTGLTITEHDIAVLGRKLFTFHNKKEGKVDYINSLSRASMAQNDITLHVARLQGKDAFFAFQDKQSHQTIQGNKNLLIKREDHLIKLLTWLMINGILTTSTNLHLTKNYLPVDLSDIQELVAKMVETFPVINFSHISSEKLLAPEVIVQSLAIINFEKEAVRGNPDIKSTVISANSYGEYFVTDYNSLAQYKGALLNLLTKHEVSRWNNNLAFFIPPQPELHALQSILEA